MRNKALLCAVGLLIAAVGWVGPNAWAATAVHCPTDDLQTAINSAAPGSTLDVYGTCPGPFIVDRNLTLVGHNGATLDGNNTYTVVDIASAVTVTMTYLIVQRGYTAGAGAGIDNAGTLNLNGVTVRQNTALANGGGIETRAGAKLTVSNSTITNNHADGSIGGGIHGNSPVTIKSSTLSYNTATEAGAAEVQGGSAWSVTNSTVTHNGAADAGGFDTEGPLTVSSSVLSFNSAGNRGGGFFASTAPITLNSSKVTGNTATTGAGAYDNNATVTFNTSSVTGNTASSSGGGVYNVSGTVIRNNSAVSGNTPDNCVNC